MIGIFLAAAFALPPVPGATNPAVTQATIGQTICVPGWTKTVRPPTGYTNAIKRKQMRALKLPGKPSDYEEDHVISLQLGGAPVDQGNLTPEWMAGRYGAKAKDRAENRLKRMVCRGQIALEAAQTIIRGDWRKYAK